MSAGTPTPLDVLREALALHLSMAASGEQPTAQSLSALDNGLAALSDVETLEKAARALSDFLEDEKATEEPPRELLDKGYAALETFADYHREEAFGDALLVALRPFAGDGNERAT